MEYGHALSKHADGTTSVKVHHQPGGASSFSLGHDNGTADDRFGNSNKVGQGQPQAAAAQTPQTQIG